MLHNQLELFTDRREAIALFNYLRGREFKEPWPLLKLTFLAPGGSGKSLLIKYLRDKECSLPDGRAVLPYAYLDFTLPHAPKDLLSILMSLRDQLQQLADGQGHYLKFPRFDLGALILRSALASDDPFSSSPTDVRKRLAEGKQFFESLSALGSTLGYAVPFVPALVAGLNVVGQVKPVRDILDYLENSKGWKWYRAHGTATGLGANANFHDVLLRMYSLSMPGKSERDYLLEHLLPEAFLADLLNALCYSDPPHAWTNMTNVVLFFDGFEDLLNSPGASSIAYQLLQGLTLSLHREHRQTDPLLIVVGSRQSLLESRDIGPSSSITLATMQDKQAIQEYVRDLYQNWQKNLPADSSFLELKDILLSLHLHDFGHDDTRDYLSRFNGKGQQTFADKQLVEALHQITSGHPLSLALATAAILGARARGRDLKPYEFLREAVSRKVVLGYEHECIDAYLLNLFMRQLSEAERNEMIYCAAPRFLNSAILQVIVPLSSDIEMSKRWNRYRHLTFIRVIDEHHIVLHPVVRNLLLQQMPPSHEPNSDYYRTHLRLREFFGALSGPSNSSMINMNTWQLQIEAAYHALALGDPEPAINLGINVQRNNLPVWEAIVEVVTQVPYLPINSQILIKSLSLAFQINPYKSLQESITIIIMFTWALSSLKNDDYVLASMMTIIGEAYRSLPGGNGHQNLKRAIRYYEAALETFTREGYPEEWAQVQGDLGIIYRRLFSDNRQENLQKSIKCYENALDIFTRELEWHTKEKYLSEWANIHSNLGVVYSRLLSENEQENLKQAIKYYEAALEIYTKENFSSRMGKSAI